MNSPAPTSPASNSATLSALIERAATFHRQGQLQQAQALYEDILRREPRHFDALHLLGVVHAQCGRGQLALEWMDKAIRIAPGHAAVQHNRANLLKTLGLIDAAVDAYSRVITLDPTHTDALFQRARLFEELGRHKLALADYDDLIRRNPQMAGAHYNRGHVLRSLGQLRDAQLSYERAISVQPDFADAHCSRGDVLHAQGQGEAAVQAYDKAITLSPANTNAWGNRGGVLMMMGQPEAALASYDKVIAIDASSAQAHANRARVLHALHRHEQAVAAFDKAIALQSDDAQAHSDKADALVGMQLLEAAFASYDQSIALRPAHAQTLSNKSVALLLGGQLKPGWELYEWRWKAADQVTAYLPTGKPAFSMSDHKKKVLVWCEQGLGDEIMFSSVLPEFNRLCAKLLVRTDARLVPLLARSMPDIEFIARGSPIDETRYDEQIAMGGMCRFLRNELESFKPASAGYLVADPDKARSLRRALVGASSDKLCGISWRSKNPHNGADRSLGLASLVKPLAMPGVRFVNLQYGDTQQEIDDVAQQLGIEVLQCTELDNLRDVDGLASLITACDFVVSVANSTVQLAGALGKDVRILLPRNCSWRWFLVDEHKSPWYASATLYRQAEDREWLPVIERVKAELIGNPGLIKSAARPAA